MVSFASQGMHIMSQFPCHNCPDRCVGCHAKCERYLAAKDEHSRRVKDFHSQLSYEAETVRENSYALHYVTFRKSNVGRKNPKRRKKDRK